MDSKINKSERQEKRRLGTGDEERERLGKRGKVRVKKDSNFSTVEPKQTMGSVHFFNIYNYNNNNSNNNNINNNHNCSNNNN